jgi:hypothetical protein
MNIQIVRISVMAITMLALLLVLSCLSDIALAEEGGDRGNESKPGISLFSVVQPLGI